MTEQQKERHPDARPDKQKPERRSAWLDKHQSSQQGDVIYVLRTTQQHHVMLGMIADQKANIILGAFLIFITVTQSVLEKYNIYNAPIWTLSAFFTVSAIFALLVIAPRFRSINPKSARPANLLFFGSFSILSQDEYIQALKDNLQNNEQARSLIMKDIYQIGKVLDKKYTNLRFSYISLGLGIIISAIVFATLNLNIS
jgi:hypothetical protein